MLADPTLDADPGEHCFHDSDGLLSAEVHADGELELDHYSENEDGGLVVECINFTVKFGRQQLPFCLPVQTTIYQLKEKLEKLVQLPVLNQKLLFKAGVAGNDDTLLEAGIPDGGKLLLLGHTDEELRQLAEAQAKAEAAAATRVPTAISATKESERQRKRKAALEPSLIDRIEVLDLPDKEFALRLLEKLKNDLGVKMIMKKHGWRVGVLKELTPLNLKLNGYNQNRGMEIAIKLRSLHEPGAWRSWPDIMETMLHELAHCDVDDHPPAFHQLNRLLNKEVISLDWTKSKGAKIGGNLDAYNPTPLHMEDSLAYNEDLDWQTATKKSSGQRLGGASKDLSAIRALLPAQMAGLMAEVRLSQKEQEQVETCGSGKSSEEIHPSDVATETPSATHPESHPTSSISAPQVHLVDLSPFPEATQPPSLEPGPRPSDPEPHLGTDCQPNFLAAQIHDRVILHDTITPPPVADHRKEPSPSSQPSLSPKPASDEVVRPSCPVCTMVFANDVSERFISNHVMRCLEGAATGASQSELADFSIPQTNTEPTPPASSFGPCPICGLAFPSDSTERFVNNHIEQCLLSPPAPVEPASITNRGQAGQSASASIPPPPCPICGMAFGMDATERFMVNHIDQCLSRS